MCILKNIFMEHFYHETIIIINGWMSLCVCVCWGGGWCLIGVCFERSYMFSLTECL